MAKRKLPALSPAETEILRIVWDLARATVQQVVDNLPADRKITYATVQTVLRRLEAKGYIKHNNDGKAHVFLPAVKKEAVIKRTVTDFLDRLSAATRPRSCISLPSTTESMPKISEG